MKTQAQLEIENAELRGQVAALREVLEKLMTKPVPAPQIVQAPCNLPHFPMPTGPTVVPGYPFWTDFTTCGPIWFDRSTVVHHSLPSNACCAGAVQPTFQMNVVPPPIATWS